VFERFVHQADKLRRISVPRQRVRIRKKITLERPSRIDERLRRPESLRLEDLRHLDDGEAFRKGDGDDEDVAAPQPVDDVERRHRVCKSILARLQPDHLAGGQQRRAKREAIAHDAGGHEALADRLRPQTGRDVDELLAGRVSAKRLPDAEVNPGAGAAGHDREEQNERQKLLHAPPPEALSR